MSGAHDLSISVGCRAAKVKYPEQSEVPSQSSKASESRTRHLPPITRGSELAYSQRSHQSGMSERSEGNDISRRAPSQSSDDRLTFSPTRHKHCKSHSSVSSFGKRLVGMLADEVVGDFIVPEPGLPFESTKASIACKSAQSSTHRTNILCNSCKEKTIDVPLSQAPSSSCSSRSMEAPSEVRDDDKEEEGISRYQDSDSKEELEESEILDSAWSTKSQSFNEKRAYFEERSKTEDDSASRQEPVQLRQSSESQQDKIDSRINKVVRQFASEGQGASEEDECFVVSSRLPTVPTPNDEERPNEDSRTGYVIRRVFRASSIADGETESSDGSVRSLEVSSSGHQQQPLSDNSFGPMLGQLRKVQPNGEESTSEIDSVSNFGLRNTGQTHASS